MTDPSALHVVNGFLLMIAAILAIRLVAVWIAAVTKADPEPEPTVDIEPEPAPAPLCHSTGPRGGHYYKGVGNEWVCARCGDTAPRGNPAPFDQELTDQQVREVMDDARRITREAAGGATA